MSNFAASLRVSRLATVFLAAPDLFLDPAIHKLTKMCLWDTLARAVTPESVRKSFEFGAEIRHTPPPSKRDEHRRVNDQFHLLLVLLRVLC